VPHDAGDDVADVGHAFLEVLVVDLGEQAGVLVEGLVQGGAGIDVAGEDGVLDLADQGGVAQQGPVGAEDGGLILSQLLGDARNGHVQLPGGGGAGLVETADLLRQGRDLDLVGFEAGQRLVHSIGPGHSHSRGNRYTFSHVGTVTVRRGAVNWVTG
jgi:hypothetical protein